MFRIQHCFGPLAIISLHIKAARFIFAKSRLLGKLYSYILDPIMMAIYSIDMTSYTVNVRRLSISHPVGVLLGGNGIISPGFVIISSGVKFVGRSPASPEYLSRHSSSSVFELGNNVFIGVNTVLVGPLKICNDVIIATMSLVNSDIVEPGTYAGIPARKISDTVDMSWFSSS